MDGKQKRMQNLKPFKKGHDERRNTKGAYKIMEQREALEQALEPTEDGIDGAVKIFKGLRKAAEKGDAAAAKIILERLYGPVKQSHEITGADGGPVQITGMVIK